MSSICPCLLSSFKNFYKRKHHIFTKYFFITFQDALDRENHSSSTLKNAISNGSLDQVQNNGCLPQCISVDIRRRPISALAANSFWSGVSEIKDVLTTGKFGKYWIYLGQCALSFGVFKELNWYCIPYFLIQFPQKLFFF